MVPFMKIRFWVGELFDEMKSQTDSATMTSLSVIAVIFDSSFIGLCLYLISSHNTA